MVATYEGAISAIERHLTENWPHTPIAFENGAMPDIVGPDKLLVPWVLCEVKTVGSRVHTLGGPSRRLMLDTGFVSLTLFERRGTGREVGRARAGQLADLFRTIVLYRVSPDEYVRTWAPTIGPGNPAQSENPAGNWWAINIMTPFEFYYRA